MKLKMVISYFEDREKGSLNFLCIQSFTLDGDLYPVTEGQRIRVGSPIEFIAEKSRT